ncbi:hypothetical protein BOTNAR_0008g00510 [Botryotinia narcissicola]|uniref:Uncharacterized protein n=1 Tax=Botryotinia narcissicola TaxID=278944 RepID=A0A4Z1J7W8_9HELO|nr:hypothetical protein BOTNAR_0008g00510 [Botryotinia narcissicola]
MHLNYIAMQEKSTTASLVYKYSMFELAISNNFNIQRKLLKLWYVLAPFRLTSIIDFKAHKRMDHHGRRDFATTASAETFSLTPIKPLITPIRVFAQSKLRMGHSEKYRNTTVMEVYASFSHQAQRSSQAID